MVLFFCAYVVVYRKCGTNRRRVLLFPIITSSFDAEPLNSLFSGNTVRKIHLNKSHGTLNIFSFLLVLWCLNVGYCVKFRVVLLYFIYLLCLTHTFVSAVVNHKGQEELFKVKCSCHSNHC